MASDSQETDDLSVINKGSVYASRRASVRKEMSKVLPMSLFHGTAWRNRQPPPVCLNFLQLVGIGSLP